MSTNDFERINSLLKLCDEYGKNLYESLEKVKSRVTDVSELMRLRLQQITQKKTALRVKFDSIYSENRKLLDKVKEKLDEIDVREMEAKREFDDFRRKVNFAKRYRRKHGLIRHFGYKFYNYGITFLTFIGWYKPPVKPVKVTKETKKCELQSTISPSQHTLTIFRSENQKAVTPPKAKFPDVTKKQQ